MGFRKVLIFIKDRIDRALGYTLRANRSELPANPSELLAIQTFSEDKDNELLQAMEKNRTTKKTDKLNVINTLNTVLSEK